MNNDKIATKLWKWGEILVGALCFPIAVNFFIAPMSLNTGGLVGLSQILSYLFVKNNSLTGLITYCFNIPLLILAYRSISRSFFVKTVVATTLQSILMSFLPIPSTPVLPDVLSNCLFAAVIGGAGIGLCLRAGGSLGGLDILGIYYAGKNPDFSVGKLSYILNAFVLTWSAMLFSLPVAMYSLIFLVVMYMVADKIHIQNISNYALIITANPEVRKAIMQQTGRGVTYWKGVGGYTDQEREILLTVFNKYETRTMRKIVKSVDPNAFFILTMGTPLLGNYEKRLV